MFKKLKEKWINDCKKILDEKGYYQIYELNIFQLWYNAKIARKVYRAVMSYKEEEENESL